MGFWVDLLAFFPFFFAFAAGLRPGRASPLLAGEVDFFERNADRVFFLAGDLRECRADLCDFAAALFLRARDLDIRKPVGTINCLISND